MRVVVMGCGRAGAALAEALSGSATRWRSSTETLRRSTGSPRNSPGIGYWGWLRPRRLATRGNRACRRLRCGVLRGQLNIIAARLARETFGVKRVVAPSTTPSAQRSTSGLASRPSPPCRGRPTGCSTRSPGRTDRHAGATRPGQSPCVRPTSTKAGSATVSRLSRKPPGPERRS